MGPPTTVSSSTLAWEAALSTHPDSRFANYIHRGLTTGFRIGFHPARVDLWARCRNHPSAYDHPEVVHSAIQAEVHAGRLV